MKIKSYTKETGGLQVKGEIKDLLRRAGIQKVDKIEIVPFGKTGCEYTIYYGPNTRTFRTSLQTYDLIITE